jgi:hypothetical protein
MGNKLTDLQLKSLIKAGKPINGISDGDGLTFTLSAKGHAAWVLRYTLNGKKKELTLGKYPDLPLIEARKMAGAERTRIAKGIDVAAAKQEKKREEKKHRIK